MAVNRHGYRAATPWRGKDRNLLFVREEAPAVPAAVSAPLSSLARRNSKCSVGTRGAITNASLSVPPARARAHTHTCLTINVLAMCPINLYRQP